MERLYDDVIDEFITKTDISNTDIKWVNELKHFCKISWRNATINDHDQLMEKYIYVWLVKRNKVLTDNDIKGLNRVVLRLNRFVLNQYNIHSELKMLIILEELGRIIKINKEIDRILNNPVISQSPLVIDLNRYKNRLLKKELRGRSISTEKGYFIVVDIFSNNSVILKKLYTGRFIRLTVDKNLVTHIQPSDVIYMGIRQNFFLGWDIDEVISYYPKEASEYIVKAIR